MSLNVVLRQSNKMQLNFRVLMEKISNVIISTLARRMMQMPTSNYMCQTVILGS